MDRNTGNGNSKLIHIYTRAATDQYLVTDYLQWLWILWTCLMLHNLSSTLTQQTSQDLLHPQRLSSCCTRAREPHPAANALHLRPDDVTNDPPTNNNNVAFCRRLVVAALNYTHLVPMLTHIGAWWRFIIRLSPCPTISNNNKNMCWLVCVCFLWQT